MDLLASRRYVSCLRCFFAFWRDTTDSLLLFIGPYLVTYDYFNFFRVIYLQKVRAPALKVVTPELQAEVVNCPLQRHEEPAAASLPPPSPVPSSIPVSEVSTRLQLVDPAQFLKELKAEVALRRQDVQTAKRC